MPGLWLYITILTMGTTDSTFPVDHHVTTGSMENQITPLFYQWCKNSSNSGTTAAKTNAQSSTYQVIWVLNIQKRPGHCKNTTNIFGILWISHHCTINAGVYTLGFICQLNVFSKYVNSYFVFEYKI